MSCSLKLLGLSAVYIALITVTTLDFELLLFFDNMTSALIDTRASIIRLCYGPAPVWIASLPCGPAPTRCIAPASRSPPARCDWPLPTIIIVHGIIESDIILLLNICTIVLVDDLYLYVDTPRSYLLIVVSWWFVFLHEHILREVQVLIVGLDHILTSWVLETISLSRGKGLLTREVGGGRILIDASLC